MELSSNFEVLRRRAVLRNRARSLCDEGYFFVLESDSSELYIAKLRHRSNGSYILIKGYPIRNEYTQKKDNVVTVEQAKII